MRGETTIRSRPCDGLVVRLTREAVSPLTATAAAISRERFRFRIAFPDLRRSLDAAGWSNRRVEERFERTRKGHGLLPVWKVSASGKARE